MEKFANAHMCSSCMTAIVGLRTASVTAHYVDEWKSAFGFHELVSIKSTVRKGYMCDSCRCDLNWAHTIMIYLASR